MTPRRRLTGLTAGLVCVLLLWNNVVVRAVPEPAYVVVNVAAAAVLLAVARAAGLSWEELGLARRHLGSGARWGGACVGLVAACYLIALAVPDLRAALSGGRGAGLDGPDLLYRALVRVPLGTVLWEEVAFRAVLLGLLLRLLPLRTAVGVSAAVFGLWHVRVLLGAPPVDGGVPVALVVLGGCAATAAAGIVFAWLRLRSGSLLAPALLHLATNALGTLAVGAAVRLG